jgi:putative SOS response-associated peptidase YedK
LRLLYRTVILSAMCGRFLASKSPDEVRRWFKTTNPLPNFTANYNVAPTHSVAVVRLRS